MEKLLRSSNVKFSPEKFNFKIKVGQEVSIDIEAKGRTPVCTSSVGNGLPPGLNFQNMKITGKATEVGVYRFTVSVGCFGTNVSGDRGSHGYELAVVDQDYKGNDVYGELSSLISGVQLISDKELDDFLLTLN